MARIVNIAMEVQDHLAKLTLNHPRVLNAMDLQMLVDPTMPVPRSRATATSGR